MKSRSLRLNFILNTSRSLLNVLIPLITFPYISRVLGPFGTGQVDFANSIISYFTLFSALGIPVYGAREIARVRDDRIKLSATVYELSLILLFTTILGYIIYFVLIFFVPYFKSEQLLFLLISPSLALSNFSYEWFYQGIEDQVYITVRFIVVKILQLVLIFMLIKEQSQYVRYGVLLVGLNGLSTLFNIAYLKRFLNRISLVSLKPSRHFKSVIIIFASIVAINIYTNLDISMIGFFCSAENVGFYTAANKLVRIVISCITAFSAVAVPRLENCLAQNKIEEYKKYLNASLHYILIFAFPCCMGLIAISSDIILIFTGEKFASSITTLKILSPITIFVPLAYFTGLEVLYSRRKEYCYTISVTAAACVNAVINALLIPRFAQNGAAWGTVVAEGLGLFLQLIFARAYLKDCDLFSFNTLKYVVSSLIMFFSLRHVPYFNQSLILHCALCVLLGIVIYALCLFALREKTVMGIIKK